MQLKLILCYLCLSLYITTTPETTPTTSSHDICILTCENGGTLDEEACYCKCAEPWSGIICDQCKLNCVHGYLDNRMCWCVCEASWIGTNCDEEAPSRMSDKVDWILISSIMITVCLAFVILLCWLNAMRKNRQNMDEEEIVSSEENHKNQYQGRQFTSSSSQSSDNGVQKQKTSTKDITRATKQGQPQGQLETQGHSEIQDQDKIQGQGEIEGQDENSSLLNISEADNTTEQVQYENTNLLDITRGTRKLRETVLHQTNPV